MSNPSMSRIKDSQSIKGIIILSKTKTGQNAGALRRGTDEKSRGPQGARRLGSRGNIDTLRMLSKPKKSIVTRSRPSEGTKQRYPISK